MPPGGLPRNSVVRITDCSNMTSAVTGELNVPVVTPNSKYQISLVVRKPVFGVSDKVRHKPGSTIKEVG